MFSEKEYADRPNKTRLKQTQKYHHNLGKQLVELTNTKFEKIPMSDRLRAAVIEGKRFDRKALKRQLKLIATLMSEENIAQIEDELEQQFLPDKQAVEAFHQLEQWRDQLLTNNKTQSNNTLNELLLLHPSLDRQYINQVIRNVAKEHEQNKPPKSSRALFQYLKSNTE